MRESSVYHNRTCTMPPKRLSSVLVRLPAEFRIVSARIAEILTHVTVALCVCTCCTSRNKGWGK